MRKRNIALIGFMGVGKSMVSAQLGQRLHIPVVSTDELIEQREGRSIAEIFRNAGEPYFRRVEKEVVMAALQQEPVIIDCGGGVVLNPDNMECLKQNATVIYLSASPEFLHKNLTGHQGKRPLLDVPDPLTKIKELLQQREAYYQQADIVLDTNGKSIDQICEDVFTRILPSL